MRGCERESATKISKTKFISDSSYQPTMIKVTGLNISISEFKMEIDNRVSIIQDD